MSDDSAGAESIGRGPGIEPSHRSNQRMTEAVFDVLPL